MSAEKKGLPRPPLFTSDYILIAEILNYAMEQFGQLIYALMLYTADGTKPDDMPHEIDMLFRVYQKKIDAAREKYNQACIAHAESGKNGGRPRKEPAATTSEDKAPETPKTPKKPKAPPKTKMPPSKKQFTKLIKDRQADGLIAAECDPVDFFEWAEVLKWKVNGEPAENAGDFLSYAAAKYPTKAVMGSIDTMPNTPKLDHAYGIIFKRFHGLRDDDGNTGALKAAIDFLKAYDGGWSFHGKEFTDGQWKDALSEFMQNLKTE